MRAPTVAWVALTSLGSLLLRVEATPSLFDQEPQSLAPIIPGSAQSVSGSLNNAGGTAAFPSTTGDASAMGKTANSPNSNPTDATTTPVVVSSVRPEFSMTAAATSPPASNTPSPNIVDGTASSGLSTGAKVGIAVGAAGAVLLVLMVVFLLWRRSRQRKRSALPGGTMGYTDDRGSSVNRDLTAEKDMQILSSPVGAYNTQETGRGQPYVNPHSPEPQQASQAETQPTSGSWPHENQQGSYDAAPGESYIPPQAPTPPAVAPPGAATTAASAGAASSRKPVGGAGNLFQQSGMSDDEVARLEEEERRIDEAIAEAERRRN